MDLDFSFKNIATPVGICIYKPFIDLLSNKLNDLFDKKKSNDDDDKNTNVLMGGDDMVQGNMTIDTIIQAIVQLLISIAYIYTAYKLMRHCNPTDADLLKLDRGNYLAPIYIIYKVLTCIVNK